MTLGSRFIIKNFRAFSAVEQVESNSIEAGISGTDMSLSVQQVVACDDRDLGCNGGSPDLAYIYLIRAGGIETSRTDSYNANYDNVPICTADESLFVVKVSEMVSSFHLL